jgi:hypothetical protein
MLLGTAMILHGHACSAAAKGAPVLTTRQLTHWWQLERIRGRRLERKGLKQLRHAGGSWQAGLRGPQPSCSRSLIQAYELNNLHSA